MERVAHAGVRAPRSRAILGKSVWRGLGRSLTRFPDFPHPQYGESFSGLSILAFQSRKKLIPGNLHEKRPDSRTGPGFAIEIKC